MQHPLSAQAIIGRNHVRQLGQGRTTIVLAHGFGCDQSMWRFVTPALLDRYKVVLFDYVGSGRSDPAAYDPRRYASLDGYARDVIEVCTALELQAPVFVGHSASGMIGALAAIAKPGLFSHLVMVGPSPRYINDQPDYIGGFERADIEAMLDMMEHNFIGWSDTMAPVIMGNEDRPELSQELVASFCSMDRTIARHWARAIFLGDNRDDLARVNVPTLVMQSVDDAIAPLSVGQFVHSRLPNSTLHVMKASGHCPHMSEPDEVLAVMGAYLDAHGL